MRVGIFWDKRSVAPVLSRACLERSLGRSEDFSARLVVLGAKLASLHRSLQSDGSYFSGHLSSKAGYDSVSVGGNVATIV